MAEKIFNIKQAIEIEKAGGFWCEACLVSHPATEQSPDPRYCLGCYDFLLKEAEMLPAKSGRPEWIPKAREISKEVAGVAGHTPQIMSTVASKKIEVDIIKPSVAARAVLKRGPKHKALPQELVKQWAGDGMGSKAIASKLNNELGINISYKTIQRALSGERVTTH
jgi:hypothetical protein